MLLSTFEHIARGALLDWWNELAPNPALEASERCPEFAFLWPRRSEDKVTKTSDFGPRACSSAVTQARTTRGRSGSSG